MEIEIIAIGNEILSGCTINSNAAYISQELLKEGYTVTRHTVLPDDASILKKGLQEAIQRNTLVITTGGLGPTCDDISRKIAAELFDSDFHFDKTIANELKERYGKDFPTIDDQATVPTKAIVLRNLFGTAPGFIFHTETATLIMLPGVPLEMKAMFSESVKPYLKTAFKQDLKQYIEYLNFFNMFESTIDPFLLQLKTDYPEINYGIYPSHGLVGVHLSVSDESETAAQKRLSPVYQFLAKKFSDFLFNAPSGRIEEAVQNRFIEQRITLSVAESCTGGSVAARLTSIPGSSQYFLGSIVAYSNRLKTDLLGVSSKLLEEKGAVNEEVVTALLKGVLEKTGSDYGAAVSGIAGPTGGTPEKPVGTVWCAVGKKGSLPFIWKLQAYGNRDMIITRSVNALLAQLLIETAKKN